MRTKHITRDGKMVVVSQGTTALAGLGAKAMGVSMSYVALEQSHVRAADSEQARAFVPMPESEG